MKINITFEHHDLIAYIRKLLAVQGMKPVDAIQFKKRKHVKGAAEEYSVEVMCEAAPLLEQCPLCNSHLAETTVPSVIPEPTSDFVADDGDEMPEAQGRPELVSIDEELGESTLPPTGARTATDGDGDDDSAASMAALTAQSRRIEIQETNKRKRQRFSTSLPGESTKPPR